MGQREDVVQKNVTGTGQHRKRNPTEPEPGSLENQNVTGQAPVDQLADMPSRPQPAGLEQQNVTRPAPPK